MMIINIVSLRVVRWGHTDPSLGFSMVDVFCYVLFLDCGKVIIVKGFKWGPIEEKSFLPFSCHVSDLIGLDEEQVHYSEVFCLFQKSGYLSSGSIFVGGSMNYVTPYNASPRFGFFSPVTDLVVDLPSPKNISVFWNFGSLLGLFLFIQLVTGVFLSFSYVNSVEFAFSSVDLIMRDVFYGSFIRIFHSNGATLFFLFLYIHMFRGLYFSTYFLFRGVWLIGCVIFVLSMAIAFFGYVLPWGNMSFWGATVITNLFSAIPYVGDSIVIWLWGGFSVSFPTLVRFFSFHFVFPFILLFFVGVHIFLLHKTGSNNPLGLSSDGSKVSFHPYFSFNDLYIFFLLLLTFSILCFAFPYLFMDAENFIEANSLVTPVHIQPEWYFLAAYAILRSVPNKLGGVLSLFGFILIYFLLPLFGSKNCSSANNWYQFLFFSWIANFFLLTWLGACPVEYPYLVISRFAFFLYFFVLCLF